MEIKIAVCDDEYQQTQYIKTFVDKWVAENNIITNIKMFGSAESFKSAVKNNSNAFDILLLDIQMDGQNGVELAKELRETNEKLIIVFITALSEFVRDGYDVSALNYLIKPIDAKKLYDVLNKAAKSLTKINNVLFLPADNGDIKILTGDIIYIESFDHFTEIATIYEKHKIKIPMYELETRLGVDFIRCHRCYIINLKYIKKIKRTEITLDSNEIIPLSRRMYPGVNKAMIKYFTEDKK